MTINNPSIKISNIIKSIKNLDKIEFDKNEDSIDSYHIQEM